jgi:hypothetical protein
MKQQITQIESAGFAFCRIGLMILIWIAFIFKIKWILILAFFILLFSAVLTVRYAPMIVIWRYTFGLLFNGKTEILNVKAMRFAHGAGTILAGISVFLLYSGLEKAGWILVGIFAILKTISAIGFCPASKLYTCMSSGTCCAFSRKVKEMRSK